MSRGWTIRLTGVGVAVAGVLAGVLAARGSTSSYISVNEDDFRTVFARMAGRKPRS